MDRIHRALGASRPAARLAILLRNQANCVIRYHLSEDANCAGNGEGWLARQVAPRCSRFVDVGANRGAWAAAFLEMMPPQGAGLLFDAARPAVKFLHDRFGDRPEIEIFHAAVSDQCGTAVFFEESDCGETSSLVGSFPAESAERVEVKVTTLDKEFEERGWTHCDFLKVDAEGYDLHVLKGAGRLLSERKIHLLQFEYNAPWALAGSTLASALELLTGHDYQVFLLKSDGLYDLDYRRYGEYFGYSNYVAVAPAWLELITPNIRGRI